MRIFFLIFGILFSFLPLEAKKLNVGVGYPYPNITSAASAALPGDSIICHDPVINGGIYIQNLQGSENNRIYILAALGVKNIIKGGSNSIQFSNAAYLHIEGFIIEGQTGNGMNIDDGGKLDFPTHHITIHSCTFRDINATGNNDLLKLSGLDDFEIRNCQFMNGSKGGSGIDMVGCHRGKIVDNTFINQGSNSIQAKGGTSNIEILRNHFDNGGARALNLGGSTGLEFFRPQDATTEAENIIVMSNVIQGSEAAIAFVGCRKIEVSNNTILFPKKWVMRILQETVDITRFLPSGDNRFYNNIIVVDQNVNIEVNIGPNTEPETFLFENNLWWKTSNNNWSGPNLPGIITGEIIGDPLIINGSIYKLNILSPAIARGLTYSTNKIDIEGNFFNNPPSLGAYEARIVSNINADLPNNFKVYPNPAVTSIQIDMNNFDKKIITLVSSVGVEIYNFIPTSESSKIDINDLPNGWYLLKIKDQNNQITHFKKLLIHH